MVSVFVFSGDFNFKFFLLFSLFGSIQFSSISFPVILFGSYKKYYFFMRAQYPTFSNLFKTSNSSCSCSCLILWILRVMTIMSSNQTGTHYQSVRSFFLGILLVHQQVRKTLLRTYSNRLTFVRLVSLISFLRVD